MEQVRSPSAWERGQQAWPALSVSEASFTAHLAALAQGSDAPSDAYAADLYLCCGCALQMPAALGALEELLADTSRWVQSVDPSPSFADEVRQQLREHLLVREENRPRPRIADYAGSGALRSWLRVIALRTALNLRRNRDDQHMRSLDHPGHELAALADQPELRLLRLQHRDALLRALRESVLSLPREQRTALRLCHAAGLTTERIASALQVHRATAVRWLSGARAQVLAETRRRLAEHLRLPVNEVDSLIDALREDLDLSLGGLLRTLEDGPTAST